MVGLALVLAWAAFATSFEVLFAKRNPALAERLTDWPQSRARLWMLAAIVDPKKFEDPSIQQAAVAWLARAPLDPEPLRSLAFHENALRNYSRARELALLSQRVTRRDELTQILLAQLDAQANQSESAMAHLGRALTTTDQGRDDIYEVMIPLMANKKFRMEMSRFVRTDNQWIAEYLRKVLTKGGDSIGYVADVILNAERDDAYNLMDSIGDIVLSAVAETGNARSTRDLFLLTYPDKISLLSNPELAEQTADPRYGWLGWTPLDNEGSGAQLGTTNKTDFGILAYIAPNRRDAVLLRRVLFLGSGNYRMTDRRRRLSGGGGATFSWSVQCYREGLWTAVSSNVADDALAFTLPADCPMQIVELRGDNRRSDSISEVMIDQVRLSRS